MTRDNLSRSFWKSAYMTTPAEKSADMFHVDSYLCVPEFESGKWMLSTQYRMISPGQDVFGLDAWTEQTGFDSALRGLKRLPNEVASQSQIGLLGRCAVDRETMRTTAITRFADGWHVVNYSVAGHGKVVVHVAVANRKEVLGTYVAMPPCEFCAFKRADLCNCPAAMAWRWVRQRGSETADLLDVIRFSSEAKSVHEQRQLMAFAKHPGESSPRHRASANFGCNWDITGSSKVLRDYRNRVCIFVTGSDSLSRGLSGGRGPGISIDDPERHDTPNRTFESVGPLCYSGKPSPQHGSELASSETQDVDQVSVKAGPKRYRCKVCFRVFVSRGNLNRHRRNIHDQELRFLCEVCGRAFGQYSDLRRHRHIHDNV
eukprot:CAMPEP_0198333164 /NCGR_PEP_ID=MMETSP1450-20131203/18777_1 /TAXON_ID=753684 ORGANISM="Madagascaria erythrocladiodes, Strain CCMP3234" /NCGR_SAMPLE_ID=MMETSP1450 /ASSEMBLY_ACC=CAM_ASM_001115 /LENGTH=372 /DNA_ID=CAMNT_0044037671 /DNA_START=420 /DNA_END=1538 /DNA_ORIENTATION=+